MGIYHTSLVALTCLSASVLSFQQPRLHTNIALSPLSATSSERGVLARPGAVLDLDQPLVADFFARFFSNPTDEDNAVAVAAKGDWRAYVDVESTGLVYYYNVKTNVSQWNPPARFPAVQLTVSEQRLSQQLQEAYQQNLSSQNSVLCAITNFLMAFLESIFKTLLESIYEKLPQVPVASEGAWQAFVERSSNTVYYYNTETGVSQWDAPTLTFPTYVNPKSKAEDDELLAVSGDWKAYFDSTDALIYYTNVKSGVRNWEAPAGFPIPKLTDVQLKMTAMKRQSVLQNFNLMESVVETTEALQSAMQEIDIVRTVWNSISDKLVLRSARDTNPPAKNLGVVAKNMFDRLVDDLSLLVKRDCSATRSVLADTNNQVFRGLFDEDEDINKSSRHRDNHQPHSVRVDPWIEKRYADSEARQANLRKNYDRVVTDRSPTTSLSAMKRDNGNKWLKYLGD